MARSKSTRRGPLPALEVRTDEPRLTRCAGLAPLLTFAANQLKLTAHMARIVGKTSRRTHPVHLVLIAFIAATFAGHHRLRHIEDLHDDALLNKFSRLQYWPCRKVFSRALAQLSDRAIGELTELITELGLTDLPRMAAAILDGDSTPLVSFGQHEGAVFGYCGKLGRNRRRHAPLVASLAATRTVIAAKYRDGSGITGQQVIDFLDGAVAGLRKRVGALPVMVRLDSGFFGKAVMAWLLEENIDFAIAQPLHAHLKESFANAVFTALDEDIDIGEVSGEQPGVRVVVVRRKVHDSKAPPPGKKIGEHRGYRYQAIASSLSWPAEDVWRFYNDRGDCERIFKEGRQALGLGCLVGHSFRSNESAFLLRLLALNLDRLFSQSVSSDDVPSEGLMSRQRRYYRSLGRLVEVGSRLVLRVSGSRWVARRWARYAPELLRSS